MSPAKKRQTMGKSTRERELRERREQKQEKKDRKKAAAEAGIVDGAPLDPESELVEESVEQEATVSS
jgi:hypothetical protein